MKDEKSNFNLEALRRSYHYSMDSFNRYSLELRELEIQAFEFEKLAVRLDFDGYTSSAKTIRKKREKCLVRISELRELLKIQNQK
ncbi:MAG: hypothetical protein ACTSSG_12590 [Candidatus Heimdallarchaeaceae archaeon]